LARAWAAISQQARPDVVPHDMEIVRRIEAFRALDGGYHPTRGCEFGTAYAAFLAVGAYQDLKADWHEPMRLVQSLKFLETNEGAFHGQWADDHVDCEYTYYGLLALGHLSL